MAKIKRNKSYKEPVFLFTSSFIFQPGIRVSLPKAITSEVYKPRY